MNFAFLAAAMLAQTAQPAPAQGTAPAAAGQQQQAAPAAPKASPQLRAAVQEFGKCMETAVAAIPPSATPEEGSKSAAKACASQLARVNSAGEAWISGLEVSNKEKASLRAKLATVGRGLEARTLERIRQMRASASARPPVVGR